MVQPAFISLLGLRLDLFTTTLIMGIAVGSLIARRTALKKGVAPSTAMTCGRQQ